MLKLKEEFDTLMKKYEPLEEEYKQYTEGDYERTNRRKQLLEAKIENLESRLRKYEAVDVHGKYELRNQESDFQLQKHLYLNTIRLKKEVKGYIYIYIYNID